jgi:hypothetical protein
MKFKVERTFLVRTYEEIDLSPKNFLHCSNIEELNNEVEDTINNLAHHPTHPNFESSEQLGVNFWNSWFDEDEKSFYLEWQKLKGLPQEL